MIDTRDVNPVHHLQKSHSEKRIAARKSKRKPKQRVIQSLGWVDEKKKRRIKLAERTKELPVKKKIIREERHRLVGHTTHTVRVNKPKESKHSENGSNNSETRRPHESKPNHQIRYDQIAHFPNVDPEARSRSRCKLEKCPYFTNVYCGKCNVHLCITTRRNCFKDFHIINTDTEA